jgi:hypothetical protein
VSIDPSHGTSHKAAGSKVTRLEEFLGTPSEPANIEQVAALAAAYAHAAYQPLRHICKPEVAR